MSGLDATCPKCLMLLQDQGPSGDPFELQILCPGCSDIYHVSCTVIGTDRTWQRLGKYSEKWKCKKCFAERTEESAIFSDHMDKLKFVKENTRKSCDTDLTPESRSEKQCAECLQNLRDKNGRLIQRLQCPDCLDAFHFSCTEIGNEGVWRHIGDYRSMWRCKQCSGFDSKSIIFKEKLSEVKRSLDIPVDIG